MICEKCGTQMQGTDCPKCGHHVELMGYSRELERLFNGGTGPLRGEPETKAAVTPEPVRPEPVKPAPVPPPPAEPEPPQPEPRKWGRILGLIASAVVLLAGVAIIAAVLGSQSGTQAGLKQAEATYGPQLEEQYQAGIRAGVSRAQATYEPQLDERYQAGKDDGMKSGIEQTTQAYEAQLTEKYDEGKQAGIEQAEATYMPLILEQYENGLEEGRRQVMQEVQERLNGLLPEPGSEPTPGPEPTPSPEPEPTPTPEPEPSPEPEPTPTPEPSPEPSPSPEPTPTPTPAPEGPDIATKTDLSEDEEESLPVLTIVTNTIFPPAGEEPDNGPAQPTDRLSLKEALRDSWEDLSPMLRIILWSPPPAEPN